MKVPLAGVIGTKQLRGQRFGDQMKQFRAPLPEGPSIQQLGTWVFGNSNCNTGFG